MDSEIDEQVQTLIQFTTDQKKLLRDYYDYSLTQHDYVNDQIRKSLEKDPIWGQILSMQSEEEAKKQSQRSQQIQGEAIFNDKWQEYTSELLTQGSTYAAMNVKYSDWQRVVSLYKLVIIPLIKRDFSNDFNKALGLILGLDLLVDFAMSVIALSYFEKKNEAIRKMNDQLEERVKQRTCELQEINEELESFTYTVSHDLRAPLRAIDGFAQVLKENHSAHLDKEGLKCINIINNSASKMGNLIDDLLTLSRIGRREIRPTSFRLNQLFKEMYAELILSRPDNNIQLTINELPKIIGDRDLMKHVVSNLLDNAIKYSSKKDIPIIEIGTIKSNGEDAVYVKDNGAGFNMKYSNKLFGVFERLHSTDEFEGTGVGLAIIQKIINKHSGRVWAESKINEGATFYFTVNKD